jgi:hypothetical protein
LAGRELVIAAAKLKSEMKAEKSANASSRSSVRSESAAKSNTRSRSALACCPSFDDLPDSDIYIGGGGSGGGYTVSGHSVQSALPDGLIDHREEGMCPKTGERMIKARIRGENPQEVWFAEGSRVVMPIRQSA